MFERLVNVICNYVEVEPEEIRPESRFMEDLGFTSFDFMSMLGELEDEFDLQVNYPQTAFAARLDVQDLRRIFFNLSSNIIKYADPQHPITLDLSFADGMLTIRQQNSISDSPSLDSSKIGLKSIRLILKSYQGTLTTQSENHQFLILISMNPVLPEISSQSSENL